MIKVYGENKKELSKVDFGIVDVTQQGKVVFYIKNTGEYTISNFGIEIKDINVEISPVPNLLVPDKMYKMELRWKPPLEIDKPLMSKINMKGVYVI